RDYKARLYFRGNVPSKPGQKKISSRVLEEEAARGFTDRGIYRKRLRHFVDGIALGSESYVLEQVERLRESGQYKRRKNAVRQLGGIHMSVREQRQIGAVF
ncbi:MAG: hypothetical protein GY847_29365, partial [Proteobacteria bacterium]|nr:hypothetical protein [Pseudomonadota bacterium]